ncbi:MAG: anti-sigma factor [Gemmatimonadetes bacterium]|nr:anti-sigma factor [Gemmatimonadota bacterium]
MTDKWTALLSAYLDGELDDRQRSELEQHLEVCAECEGVLAGLKRVVNRAVALDDRPPARDLWPGIADRIGLRSSAQLRSTKRRLWIPARPVFSVPQLAAAAVALVVVSAGVTAVLIGGGDIEPQAVELAASDVGGAVLASLVNQEFDEAVRDLEMILAEGREFLDSSTVRVIEETLEQIDLAIQEAREVLATDPASSYLNNHLAATMRMKLRFLNRSAEMVQAVRL